LDEKTRHQLEKADSLPVYTNSSPTDSLLSESKIKSDCHSRLCNKYVHICLAEAVIFSEAKLTPKAKFVGGVFFTVIRCSHIG